MTFTLEITTLALSNYDPPIPLSLQITTLALELRPLHCQKLRPASPLVCDDIGCLETLAQLALVFIATKFFPGSRIPIRIPMLSDNTTAESLTNKLFFNPNSNCFLPREIEPPHIQC